MALTLAGLQARIDRQLKLLGKQSTDVKNDNISDAVAKFMSKMDVPIHSANISVVSGTTKYSTPASIRKIQDIRDADGDSVNFSLDQTTKEIVLQSTPSASGTYPVYGTWNDIRTNLSYVVADIDTSLEHVLWAYIVAYCYEWANEDTAATKLQKANFLAIEERESNNVALSLDFVTNQSLDTTGQKIGDTGNAEGFNMQIDDLYESNL